MDIYLVVFAFLGGLGSGVFLSFILLERYYQLLNSITRKLDQFKAEGEGEHWLK